MKTQRTDAEWNEMTAEQKREWAETMRDEYFPSQAQPAEKPHHKVRSWILALAILITVLALWYGFSQATGLNNWGGVTLVSVLPLWGALVTILATWIARALVEILLDYVARPKT